MQCQDTWQVGLLEATSSTSVVFIEQSKEMLTYYQDHVFAGAETSTCYAVEYIDNGVQYVGKHVLALVLVLGYGKVISKESFNTALPMTRPPILPIHAYMLGHSPTVTDQ